LSAVPDFGYGLLAVIVRQDGCDTIDANIDAKICNIL